MATNDADQRASQALAAGLEHEKQPMNRAHSWVHFEVAASSSDRAVRLAGLEGVCRALEHNPTIELGLRFVAWMVLLLSITGGLVIWAQFGSIEVPQPFGGTRKSANPAAIGMAIGAMINGLVWFVALSGLARALERLARIDAHVRWQSTKGGLVSISPEP